MMKQRSLFTAIVFAALMIFSSVEPALAAGAPKQTTPPMGAKAGSISALLPVAKIYRGLGKNQSSAEVKKGDDVVWNDLVRTEKGGRARITLNDQSILSLGSQAELRIVKHDARSQQTALELGYGRIRAEVASVTRDGGKFELRTPTAVAGVIGTDFGSDSSIPGATTFICISGMVQVSNSDPNVPGTVPCPAGETTTVNTGLAPTAPKPATQQQIQQLIQDTEPAVIAALSPASALQGVTLAATATGTHMSGINGAKVSGNGVTATLNQGGTESSASVSLVVAADAAPGPRTITFTKANGQATAVIFQVLAPPNQQGPLDYSALKKAYDALFEQMRLSEISGINAVGVGVQQSAALGGQQVAQANSLLSQPLNIDPMQDQLSGNVKPLINGMQDAGGKVNAEVAGVVAGFDTGADALGQQLAGKDDELRNGLKDLFDKQSALLTEKIQGIHDSLGGDAKASNDGVVGTVNVWLAQIGQAAASQQQLLPAPKLDAEERSVELGAVAAFDGGRSVGANGSSIASYQWQLCDPSYKPAQVGVLLPASDVACHGIAGFGASSSDLKVATCSLQPQDYIARLTVTDVNGKSGSMDARLKVLSPSYDDPQARTRGLANAYQSLQINQILGYFDDSFAGLNALQESMRRTFETLASMNINLRISQANVSCNDATVRADWDQAYTFLNDQTCAGNLSVSCNRVVFKQTEQLTMRMTRDPGKGWLITDFQGDNGTVQGLPPGPVQTDTAKPDLVVTKVATLGGGSLVSPGSVSLIADVQNVGVADLTQAVPVHFSLRDAVTNNEIVGADATVASLAAGQSVPVQATVTLPAGTGLNLNLSATVNPACAIAEKDCTNNTNLVALTVAVGTVDLQLTNLVLSNAASHWLSQQTQTATFDIANLGNAPSGNDSVTCQLGTTNLAAPLAIASIAGGGTRTGIVLSGVVPINLAGNDTVTCTVSQDPLESAASIANNLATAAVIVDPNIDLQLVNIPAVPATQQQMGATGSISFGVKNFGADTSPAGYNVVFTIGGPQVASFVATSTLAGGATQPVTLNFTLPQVAPAPADVPNVPAVIQVNANNAVVETITANDSFSTPLELVDFAATTVATSFTAVQGRSFNASGLFTLLPATYGLPLQATYSPLPVGVTPSGTPNAVNLVGTPTSTGTFNVNIALSNSGVTHTASAPFTINVLPEINVVETATPSLVANGAAQPLTVSVSGGIFPVTVSIALPTGIITANSTSVVLNAAGSITWNLAANTTALAGAQSIVVTASDAGSLPNTPARTITFPLNYSVNGTVDILTTITNTSAAGNWTSGETRTFSVGLQNLGNVTSSSSDSLTCIFDGALAFNSTAPALAGGASTTLNLSMTVPINHAGASKSLGCTVAQDPQESTLSTANNTASFTVAVDPNVDLTITQVVAPIFQIGATQAFAVTVRNLGLDDAAAGWSLLWDLGGNTSTLLGSTLTGGAQQVITYTQVTPALFSAPAVNASVASTVTVNANGAVLESPGAGSNNTNSGTVTVADFTIANNTSGTLTGVVGRSFSVPTAVLFQPASYPIPVSIAYPFLPPGLAGTNTPYNQDVTGTPTAALNAVVSANVTVDGVNRSVSSPLTVSVVPEISMTPAANLSIITGASPQSYSINVDGGIFPLTVTLGTLPAGITTDNNPIVTLGAAGTVTWGMTATSGVVAGNYSVPVTITDAGVPATNTPAGNKVFSLPLSVNGQANYILASANPVSHSGNPVGSNAFQVGENVDFDVVVQNVGTDTTSGGTITVDMACTPSCGSHPATVAAPIGGQSATAHLTLPVSLSTGNYNGQISITSAPPQTSTADDSLTGFAFDVADFALSSTDNFAVQNVLIGGAAASWNVAATDTPNGAALTLSAAASTDIANVSTVIPASIGEGASAVSVSTIAALPAATGTLTLNATRFGVTKTLTQPVNYYNATIDFDTPGQPGDTAANPISIGIGTGAVASTIFFDLHGTFDPGTNGGATLVLSPTGGITPSSFYTILGANNFFSVDFAAGAGASAGTVTPVTISFQIPNTSPAQTVSRTIYFLPTNLPNLIPDAPTPVIARDFSATSTGHPIITGEVIDFNVTLHNTGGGASSGNHALTLLMAGSQTYASGFYAAPIPAGGSVNVVMTAIFITPPLNSTSNTLQAVVQVDPLGESNISDNVGVTTTVASADWSLGLTGLGSTSGTPLPVVIGTGTPTTVNVLLGDPLAPMQGSPASPIHIFKSLATSHVTSAALDGAGSTLTSSVILPATIALDASAPNGEFAYAVEGDLESSLGAVLTRRSLTIHIAGGTGVPNAVTITSSAGNATPEPCLSACPAFTPQHLDGPLPTTIGLTPVSSGTSSVDLIYTDDAAVVSNVDLNGIQGVPIQNNVLYNQVDPVNFAAEDSSGFVTTGQATVVVSAAAAGASARVYGVPDATGTQRIRLYFDIGDFDIGATSNASSCIVMPDAGAVTPVTISWFQLGSGIQSNLTNVTWSTPSGVVLSSGPTSIAYDSNAGSNFAADSVFTFTNNAIAGSPEDFGDLILTTTLTNSQNGATVTKSFDIPVILNSGICNLGGANKAGASVAGGNTIRGVWKRPATGSTSAARRAVVATAGKLPDLQLKQSDVSFSPSVPKAGDTINVRFRLTNAGDGDATHVPVALQVNGRTVATDYFDVQAGKSTLAGLEWANAQLPAGTAVPNVINIHRGARMGGGMEAVENTGLDRPLGRTAFRALVVIDPAGTIKQKSTALKTAALSQFSIGVGDGFNKLGGAAAGFERVMIEAGEGCTGVRLTSGAQAPCESADMDIMVEDIGAGKFAFTSTAGIHDLGTMNISSSASSATTSAATMVAQSAPRAVAMVGHSYAVQLSGGRIASFTVNAIQNPRQLSAAAQKRFQKQGRKIMGRMGGDTQAVEPGDVSGHEASTVVYFDITYRVQ